VPEWLIQKLFAFGELMEMGLITDNMVMDSTAYLPATTTTSTSSRPARLLEALKVGRTSIGRGLKTRSDVGCPQRWLAEAVAARK
jgi:hypothetical protein